MTYKKIFDLKINKKIPTAKLHQAFPKECLKVTRVALLQLPTRTLKELIRDGKKLDQLLILKQKLKSKKTNGVHS